MAMFHLLKMRTSIDIFKNEKCKVTFGFEYSKTGVYRGKHFFLIFAPKHRFWVLIRTASPGRF